MAQPLGAAAAAAAPAAAAVSPWPARKPCLISYLPALTTPQFMDAANRRLGLAFLLEYAYRQPDCQLLLLTPQDTSGAIGACGEVLRVLCMPAAAAGPKLFAHLPARCLQW